MSKVNKNKGFLGEQGEQSVSSSGGGSHGLHDNLSESSIAWFKLAELVSRGEKEKALNLYRLLSHSFEERAYSLQVEGDILWAFEDDEAIVRYTQAAFLYKKNNNIASSIAIYEHLLTFKPTCYDFIHNLILLYSKANWGEKLKEKIRFAIELVDRKEVSQLEVMKTFEEAAKILSDNKLGSKSGKSILKSIAPILSEKFPNLYGKAL